MSSRIFSRSLLALAICASIGVSTPRAAAPPGVVEDIERLLGDPALLGAVASLRIEEVLRSFEDPAWGGNLNHEIYSGLRVRAATKYWLAGPEARSSHEIMHLVVVPLYQIEEAVKTASEQAALPQVSQNVVAAELADRLLAQLEGEDARLREIVQANLGLAGPPVAGLALLRVDGPPRYFQAILEETLVLKDPWTCAMAAQRLSRHWVRRHWLSTLSEEELLRVAQPTGPFDHPLRQDAVEELQARAPHTDWPEAVDRQESDLLARYLSDQLSEPPVIRLPPLDLLQEIALQALLGEQEGDETESLHHLLLQRAVDNNILGKAVLSRSPETLAAVGEVTNILAKVTADPEFFLGLLKRWDVVEQGALVAAALERIRGMPEVGDWLATLRDEELEHVAANKEALFSAWIVEAAGERLNATRPRPPG